MELLLTSEQSQLRDSAAKFAQDAGPKVARSFRNRQPAFAPARLRMAAELGWLAILVPESLGGLGLGLTELALVLHQAGRGLVCEPIGLCAISAFALAQWPDRDAPASLANAMAGKALIVPALQESAHGGDDHAPATGAKLQGRTATVSGRKTFVCADGADGFLVGATGPDGPMLCYVASEAPGCTLTMMSTVEGRQLATLALDDAAAEVVSASPQAIANLNNLALIALSAELLGVMERAQDITLDYLRTRKQFGKLIGSFQALQHKAVDNYIRIEATRSLVFQAAANSDPGHIDSALAAAVKAQASEAAMFVTKSCIQLHGAIGFTDEHDIGLYHKRALLLCQLFGDEAQQRRRYAKLTAGVAAA
jgi:alkylation response protein AidB-like acyl-CoA dehydrogenase